MEQRHLPQGRPEEDSLVQRRAPLPRGSGAQEERAPHQSRDRREQEGLVLAAVPVRLPGGVEVGGNRVRGKDQKHRRADESQNNERPDNGIEPSHGGPPFSSESHSITSSSTEAFNS